MKHLKCLALIMAQLLYAFLILHVGNIAIKTYHCSEWIQCVTAFIEFGLLFPPILYAQNMCDSIYHGKAMPFKREEKSGEVVK